MSSYNKENIILKLHHYVLFIQNGDFQNGVNLCWTVFVQVTLGNKWSVVTLRKSRKNKPLFSVSQNQAKTTIFTRILIQYGRLTSLTIKVILLFLLQNSMQKFD